MDDRSKSDRELVDRCLSGDSTGILEFVAAFQTPVFSVCLRLLGHQQDAEDVTQESLVRAVRYIQRWDRLRSLKTWVLTIAINRCRTHQSKRLRCVTTVSTECEYLAPQARLTVVDLSEVLQQALSQLRDEYRTCFLLFHQQDLSVREIAQMLETQEGTIKTWLHRARKELAASLRQGGVVTENGHELFRI